MPKKPVAPPAPPKPVAKKAKTKTGLTGRGGPGRGQGRKPGVPTKRNQYKQVLDKLQAQQEAAADGDDIEYDKHGRPLGPVYGTTPLEFMLGVMNDRKMPTGFRAAAAKDSAPYVHSKLATVEVKGNINNTNTNYDSKTAAEFTKIARKLVKEI
jgi:hypothetical protein